MPVTAFESSTATLPQGRASDSVTNPGDTRVCRHFEESEAMDTVIRKWGNSTALRLPTAVLKEAGYQLEQKVDLVVSRGRIIVQPSKKLEYDLDALANGIHAGNTHDEVNFGRPVGNEAL